MKIFWCFKNLLLIYENWQIIKSLWLSNKVFSVFHDNLYHINQKLLVINLELLCFKYFYLSIYKLINNYYLIVNGMIAVYNNVYPVAWL